MIDIEWGKEYLKNILILKNSRLYCLWQKLKIRTGPTFFFLVPVESRSEPKSSSSSSFGLFFRPRPTFPLLSLSSSSFSTSCLTSKLPSRRPLASDAVERLEDESRLNIQIFYNLNRLIIQLINQTIIKLINQTINKLINQTINQ